MAWLTRPQVASRTAMGPVRAVTILVVVLGFLLSSAPAQAASNNVTISSVDIAAPALKTGAVKGRVTAVASNGAPVTYVVAKPAKGTASISTAGVFTYTPTAAARHRAAKDGAPAADGRDVLHVVVTDSSGHRESTSVRVPILGANRAPVVSLALLGTPDPTTGVVTGRITATDPDGDSLTYRLTSNTSSVSRSGARHLRAVDPEGDPLTCPSSAGSLSVNAATGSFTYTPTSPPPPSGVSSTDNFTVTVSDGYGGSTSTPVAVPVTAPNPSTGVVTGNA